MVRTCRKFPIEWEKYEAIGNIIENTRIFAFKTPLKLNLQKKIHKSMHFTTINLFKKVAEWNRSLGLIINLNNTDRYYDCKEFEGMLISYKSIQCPGRGFLLRTDIVKSFCKIVDNFLAENQDNDNLIGVHSTNGVNRSGYLICRYLIDRLGWSSHDALNAFEVARGYPIERGAFVQSLHKADRENRLKGKKMLDSCLNTNDDLNENNKKKKKKKKKDELNTKDFSELDPALTAQIMQQFFQMEQQFKEVAENAILNNSYIPSSFKDSTPSLNYDTTPTSGYQQNSTVVSHQTNINFQHQYQKSFSQLVAESSGLNKANNALEVQKEENITGNDESERVIDYESMGKVEVREVSATENRRIRRKRLDNQFKVMKRGRFWEINEMRKDMGY